MWLLFLHIIVEGIIFIFKKNKLKRILGENRYFDKDETACL